MCSVDLSSFFWFLDGCFHLFWTRRRVLLRGSAVPGLNSGKHSRLQNPVLRWAVETIFYAGAWSRARGNFICCGVPYAR